MDFKFGGKYKGFSKKLRRKESHALSAPSICGSFFLSISDIPNLDLNDSICDTNQKETGSTPYSCIVQNVNIK